LKGLSGNDSLAGASGFEKIYGGSDNDVLLGDEDDDSLLGGAGDDSVQGGDGDDTLKGGSGHDMMMGDAGNYLLMGQSGRDELHGGDDDDLLAGGSNDDLIYGDAGNDTGSGQVGSDTIWGGDGDDLLTGMDGDDVLYGGAGDDRVYGGNNDDIVVGGDDDDTLRGGSNRDIVMGGNGRDILHGDDQGDILIGGLTLYDVDTYGLELALEVWASVLGYEQRVAILSQQYAQRGATSSDTNYSVSLQSDRTIFNDFQNRWGLIVPYYGDNVIDGGYFNNRFNIVIDTAREPTRSVTITGNVQFGNQSEALLRGRSQIDVLMRTEIIRIGGSYDHIFMLNQVTLNYGEFSNQRLYANEQHADFVPFPKAGRSIADEQVGLTNQQLMTQFGIAVGGEVALTNASSFDRITGLVGP
jgi:Ca2+-binding RTX toxin-like protein